MWCLPGFGSLSKCPSVDRCPPPILQRRIPDQVGCSHGEEVFVHQLSARGLIGQGFQYSDADPTSGQMVALLMGLFKQGEYPDFMGREGNSNLASSHEAASLHHLS